MARSLGKDPSISQKNDASRINNKRGMARRAKRNSNKRDRQFLQRDLEEREREGSVTSSVTTTNGSQFTLLQHVELARLVYLRFGEDPIAATAAWRRLLENDCTESDFMKLVHTENCEETEHASN